MIPEILALEKTIESIPEKFMINEIVIMINKNAADSILNYMNSLVITELGKPCLDGRRVFEIGDEFKYKGIACKVS